MRKDRDFCVQYISRKLCIKSGVRLDLAEAHAMEFIRRNTSIPVPKVYCAFKRKRVTYIVMERLAGKKLTCDWYIRTPESRAIILSQLRRMIEELQQITPPTNCRISNLLGGPISNGNIAGHPDPAENHGPFGSVKEFHHYLHQGAVYHTENHPKVNELLELHEHDWPIKFTHGDLSSLNILAQGDRVTGIVDWETAGWYPSYWEYTSACYVNPWNLWWRDYIDAFIEPIPDALHMETLRSDLCGPLGCVL